MATVVLTEDLTKFYGETLGIEGVDFEVAAGEVFGFLGPNGAGKSTTIRLLLDVIRPTRGACRVFGLDSRAGSMEIRRRVGYVPGELAMYDRMTARELFTYFASLRGMANTGIALELAERFELDPDRRIRSYSTGNRQKAALIQALMHEPELLILDEPTSGLDPLMQQEFYGIALEAKAEGRTVFLSSHVLPEVERIADRVGIIRNGSLVTVEEVASLKQRALRRLELTFAAPVPIEEFTTLDTVRSATAGDSGSFITVSVAGAVDPVIKAAARHELVNLVSHEGDLEGAFLAYYEEGSGQ